MPKEYEAKFLNIDVDTIKKILRKNGAKKIRTSKILQSDFQKMRRKKEINLDL